MSHRGRVRLGPGREYVVAFQHTPQWRLPVSLRHTRPWSLDYPNHNLDWDAFQQANAQNAGHEIYRFLAEMAVNMDGVHAEAAALMRALCKDFRDAIDPLIVAYITRLNNEVISKLKTAVHGKFNHSRQEPARASAEYTEYAAERTRRDADVAALSDRVETKFGFHVASNLKKCMSMHCEAQVMNSLVGWAWKPNDLPRLSYGIRGFLAMAGKHTCELHAGKKSCDCSKTIGGGFCFVPNGGGLILHCCQRCIDEHVVVFNPSSGCPVVSHTRREPQNAAMKELVEAYMLQVHIQPPYSRDAIRHRFGDERWLHFIQSPQEKLDRAHAGSLRLMVDSHPSLRGAPDDRYRDVANMGRLLELSADNKTEAVQWIQEKETLRLEIAQSRRDLVHKHCERQFNRMLSKHVVREGIDSITVAEANNLLPGTLELVSTVIFDRICKSPEIEETVDELTILSLPYTLTIIHTVSIALGRMRRKDMQHSGTHATPFAYSYVTGLCAGKDIMFDEREISAQINMDVVQILRRGDFAPWEEEEASDRCWRALITTMHVFDSMDYTTIRVVKCPMEEISVYMRDFYGGSMPESGTVLKWTFQNGGATFSGPIVTSTDKSWYERKANAGAALLTSLGFKPELINLPADNYFRVMKHNSMEEVTGHIGEAYRGATTSFINWFQHTAQHLCARPETRALGLDILTCDKTRMLISIVEDHDLDPEVVATAAQMMQIDEAAEDAT